MAANQHRRVPHNVVKMIVGRRAMRTVHIVFASYSIFVAGFRTPAPHRARLSRKGRRPKPFTETGAPIAQPSERGTARPDRRSLAGQIRGFWPDAGGGEAVGAGG